MDTKIVFNNEILKTIGLFSQVTRISPKDCFEDDNQLLTFIVGENQILIAIGKAGANVKRIEALLKRKIRIIEHSNDVKKFVANVIMPLKATNITVEQETGIVTIEAIDLKTRGLLIGRNAKNLRNYEKIVQKYYNQIKEIKVVQ